MSSASESEPHDPPLRTQSRVMSAAMLKTLRTAESEESMRALYRTYGPELYGFAVSALGDRGQAEELVQEVFTRVWRKADSFDPERASFRTWLYGIARNAIIDQKRRAAVRPALAAHEEAAGLGLEPRLPGPEPGGLPLPHPAMGWRV